MRELNLDSKCNQSSITLGKTRYTLTNQDPIEGDGCFFTVDEPGKSRDQIYFTKDSLRALYGLITKGK